MKLITTVYKSKVHEGMYLFVEREQKFEQVPKVLLDRFAEPEELMTLVLTPEKKLAQAKASDVIEAINHQGYYLQITREQDREMMEVAIKNQKLHGK